jgi:asparagine synthase (glutamine-hydrolysing)
MCGIEFLIGTSSEVLDVLKAAFVKSFRKGLMAHRGPDHSALVEDGPMVWGFRRRMIQGLDPGSNEPLILTLGDRRLTLVCNGEIYNHRPLKAAHPGWSIKTHNDCEVILHLYATYGIRETLKRLDGEFAFILHDSASGQIYMARDHLGIRPLYLGAIYLGEGPVGFAASSELEGLTGLDLPTGMVIREPKQLVPRKIYYFFDDQHGYISSTYKRLPYPVEGKAPDPKIVGGSFEDEVRKRVSPENRDVPLAITVSGGIDSSLVAACAVKILRDEFGVDPSTIPTFCVGKEGSPDLLAAREVTTRLGTDHHEVIVTDEDLIEVVKDEAIRRSGSFCRTTIRAIAPHLLVARAIAQSGKAIVVLSGEIADEIWGSYAYFAKAPDATAFGEESRAITSRVYLSDALRADRAIAAYGLELRCPFSGQAFVDYVMSLDPSCKMFSQHVIEKQPLRQAFSEGYLPPSVLNRRKNGMSDAVSSSEASWVDGLLAWIDTQVADHEVPDGLTKEAFYYRKRFCEIFGPGAMSACTTSGHLPRTGKFYEWMPNPDWCPDATDPSGRQGLDLGLAD